MGQPIISLGTNNHITTPPRARINGSGGGSMRGVAPGLAAGEQNAFMSLYGETLDYYLVTR